MQSFSMELTSKQLKAINIGFDMYTLFKGDFPFFIVGRSSTNFSEVFIENVLKLIYNEFWMKHSENILEFMGSSSVFSNFLNTLQHMTYN